VTAFNHLTGTLDPTDLSDLPAVTAPIGDPLSFEDVQIVHATFELLMTQALQCLPPAVHPSIPGHLSLLVVRSSAGPLGPLALAQIRVGCRAGVKRRAFCLAAVTDNPLAARTFVRHFGFPCRLGGVTAQVRHYATRVAVDVDGQVVLGLTVAGTRPLDGATLSYPATLNLAASPEGPRLLQIDSDVEISRVERGVPSLAGLDLSPWGYRLEVQQPVAATVATGTMALQPVRPA
jgi:hypothetical protein